MLSLHPTNFDVVFSFSSEYFKISIEISSLNYMLFQSVLFNLDIFGAFPVIFLLMISSLIPLWCEGRHCMIYLLLNLFSCVL